jgi:hypothetical protein
VSDSTWRTGTFVCRTADQYGQRSSDAVVGSLADSRAPDTYWSDATSEVADALDASRNTVYKKLRVMEEDGDLTGRKAGGIRVWSVTENLNG